MTDIWPKAAFSPILTDSLRRSMDAAIFNADLRPSDLQHGEPVAVPGRDHSAFACMPTWHAYLATVIRDLNSPWVVVGGVADHVHILLDIGKLVATVKFVEQVKRDRPNS